MNDNLAEQKLRTAILRSAELLADNSLGHWKIKINNRRAVLAQTSHKEKTISYSKRFLLIADKEQLEGVTLHEATHALLGRGFGHGKEFVDLCSKISPTTTYARSSANVSIRKYLLTCPSCGQTGSTDREKARYCGICFKKGDTVRFTIQENNIKVALW